jgi:RimJ/RimL family protein N-acetyltransferase
VTVLTTARLRLRPFRADDFEAYAALMADAEVMRYLGAGLPLDRAEAWRSLATVLGHWQLRGFGLWAAEEIASGELVGRIGCWQPEGWPGFEVGWLLRRASWGHGYATEGARAALAFAFDELGRDRVISLIHPDNERSIRVAERLGASLDGRTELLGRPALIYLHRRGP